ncbi:hypothetical protein ANCCAN_05651 [Ancylostoma caninum]|uniref:Uncharacterized protein n=1 Tax=Ancylostoma caninum TaxID=29170 RepID=A0A368GV37_ANCCA|nr:hypothetical protein ANCCAN_05651 [Ancylostoma caninum]
MFIRMATVVVREMSPIYCYELTAKILPVVMGKRAPSSTFLRPLKVGESYMIEPNLLVTVLDAHHCLGSVMFLFELVKNRNRGGRVDVTQVSEKKKR